MVLFYGICTQKLDVNPTTGLTVSTIYSISLQNKSLFSKAFSNSNWVVFELKYPSGKTVKYPFM